LLAQLDWNVPDYSTLPRRQKTLTVAITARSGLGGLHLLVDSTGVKMLGEGEWKIMGVVPMRQKSQSRCDPGSAVAMAVPMAPRR
jgi:hypothetical protein